MGSHSRSYYCFLFRNALRTLIHPHRSERRKKSSCIINTCLPEQGTSRDGWNEKRKDSRKLGNAKDSTHVWGPLPCQLSGTKWVTPCQQRANRKAPAKTRKSLAGQPGQASGGLKNRYKTPSSPSPQRRTTTKALQSLSISTIPLLFFPFQERGIVVESHPSQNKKMESMKLKISAVVLMAVVMASSVASAAEAPAPSPTSDATAIVAPAFVASLAAIVYGMFSC
ncbi:hypothetical protein ACLOJK_028724 [Asimina triloba]